MKVLAEMTICPVARDGIVCYAARSLILFKNLTKIWKKVNWCDF
jgi:hypothetical protein